MLQNSRKSVATGNQEIDGILDFLLDQARKTLTEVRTEITIPEGIFPGETLSSVRFWGIFWTNAIREAEKKQNRKYLGNYHVYEKTGCYSYALRTATQETSSKSATDSELHRKTEKNHGQGLENVRKMVELCKGEMDISYTEDLFKVEVLLYLKEIETIKKKKG